jgi:hypothetical protein
MTDSMYNTGGFIIVREVWAAIRKIKSLEALSLDDEGALVCCFFLWVDPNTEFLSVFNSIVPPARESLSPLALAISIVPRLFPNTVGGTPLGMIEVGLDDCDEDRDPSPPIP